MATIRPITVKPMRASFIFQAVASSRHDYSTLVGSYPAAVAM